MSLKEIHRVLALKEIHRYLAENKEVSHSPRWCRQAIQFLLDTVDQKDIELRNLRTRPAIFKEK